MWQAVIRQLRARTLRWSCIRCCPDRLSPGREDGVPSQLRSHSPECRNHSLPDAPPTDRKSTRLNSSHSQISYAVFCLKKKKSSMTYSIMTEESQHTTAT